MENSWWKYVLSLGIGVAVGAAGAMLLSRNPGAVKKTCATLLSHAMEVKEKAATVMETAKENMEDLAAEARHDYEERKKATSGVDA
jgi:gas vesicle protein